MFFMYRKECDPCSIDESLLRQIVERILFSGQQYSKQNK